MKKYLFVALSGLMMWAMTACKPNGSEPEPYVPQDTAKKQLPAAFAKIHLMEEFTGQDCGYCPNGMDCVADFVNREDNSKWIVVLHHYGYSEDHFSVLGSKSITNTLGVDGAPSIAIDRASTKYSSKKGICFHPGYLPEVNSSQFADSTDVSLELTTIYNAETRKLRVQVNGLVLSDHPQLKLTVLVKESGMIDYQADYYSTFEGWQEFRHANAVRAYLTESMGDVLTLAPNDKYEDAPLGYTAEYEIDFDAKWLPENSSVVAFVSENFKPVLQAAQQPVVGKGGADILHGGITRVPVADYYPEPGADVSPSMFTQTDSIAMPLAYAYYTPYTAYGFNYWQIMAYDANASFTVGQTACVPFAYIYLFTQSTQTSIPAGIYPINGTYEPGTVYAGMRDDEEYAIGGSSLYLTSKSYFNQGYLVPAAEWLIVDGTMIVTDFGWLLTGHARNGSEIRLVGTTPISNQGQAPSAPQRVRAAQGLQSDFPVCIPGVPAQATIVNRK